MRVSRVACIAGILCVLPFGLLPARSQSGGYHLLKNVPLGAAPGGGEYFDYLTFDPSARRLYLSHGTEVKVLDPDNDRVVGAISGLKRCHGIALVSELGKGFITDGTDAKVIIFDIASLQPTGAIHTQPDA